MCHAHGITRDGDKSSLQPESFFRKILIAFSQINNGSVETGHSRNEHKLIHPGRRMAKVPRACSHDGSPKLSRSLSAALLGAPSLRSTLPTRFQWETSGGRGMGDRRREQAILKDIARMADRYDVPIKTAVRSDVAPDKAILSEAKKGCHDLIVMGVNRRSGDVLFFGDTAAAVFETSPASILLLSS